MPGITLRICLVAILLVLPCLAQARIKPDEREQGGITDSMTALIESEQALRGIDYAQWTDEALSKYLISALHAVHQALIVYATHQQRLPESAAVMREADILPQWPGNPLANWEPLDWQLYEPWMEFKPGALVLQTVPGALCTQGQEGPVPVELDPSGKTLLIWQPYSFVLSINAPALDYTPRHEVISNCSWAVIPPGTVTLSTFESTMRKSDYEGHEVYLKQKAREQYR